MRSGHTDNKAIRDLRDELKDLNKTIKQSIKASEIFTIILLTVGLLQLVIGIFQFAATPLTPRNMWIGLILEIIVLTMGYFLVKKIVKDSA